MAFLGTVIALVVVGPTGVNAQAASLRADQLTIVDSNATDRIRIAPGPGPVDASVKLFDTEGRNRIAVDMGGPRCNEPEAYGFLLRNSDGAIVGNLGIAHNAAGALDGGVTMTLSDQQGRARARMQVDGDGTPGLQLLDADGNVTWSAP